MLVLVVALVLYMRCHQIGKCYRDKTVTVTVAATRYVAAVVALACSCSFSCSCISGKAAASAARPFHASFFVLLHYLRFAFPSRCNGCRYC